MESMASDTETTDLNQENLASAESQADKKPGEETTGAESAEDEITHLSPGRAKLHSWLYKLFRIVLTDGRVLSGAFLCTDSDANIILGMCSEDTQKGGEERMLGLVMVPGRHIVSMEMDASFPQQEVAVPAVVPK